MLDIDGQTILYRQPHPSVPLRLFMLVIGLGVGLGIPLPFLLYPDWTRPDPLLLIALVGIVAGLGVGGVLTAAALWSAAEIQLDPATGRATRVLRGPVVNRRDSFPLAELRLSDVILRDSDDGPFPLLRLSLPRGLPIDIACFLDRDEAERWRRRIAATLQP